MQDELLIEVGRLRGSLDDLKLSNKEQHAELFASIKDLTRAHAKLDTEVKLVSQSVAGVKSEVTDMQGFLSTDIKELRESILAQLNNGFLSKVVEVAKTKAGAISIIVTVCAIAAYFGFDVRQAVISYIKKQ